MTPTQLRAFSAVVRLGSVKAAAAELGVTEAAVKQFNKRVKGTEQFWNVPGAEAILALRSKWLSEDEESTYYWLGWPAKAKAA